MQRRQLLGTTAALGALALTGRAPAVHAQDKKISLLTWNIPHLKDLIMAWGEEFKKRTGAELEWLDKKGTELPAFYQTQLVAGTPPDIINTQGALWLEYADSGALLDLTPMFEKEPDVKARFNADYLANWTYQDRNFMFPFYITKTLLFYNKTLFKEAGIAGPPQSFDDLLAFAGKIKGGEKTGMLTLNFDWLYWPLMKMNGIDLLSPDLKEAVFNTDKTREVVERLAAGTADGSINKIAWTGRWVEPNGAFASGTVGMHHAHSPAYFAIKGQGPWVNPETLGATHAPGGWATPNSHGLGISKGSKNPELAWEFLKMMTEEDWALKFGTTYKVLPGNAKADPQIIESFRTDDPLAVEVLKTQLEFTDRQTGNWRTAADSKIKEAFWPEIQAALLGQKPVKEALDEADRKVARVLRRA